MLIKPADCAEYLHAREREKERERERKRERKKENVRVSVCVCVCLSLSLCAWHVQLRRDECTSAAHEQRCGSPRALLQCRTHSLVREHILW